jgi:DNA polymerase-4
MDEGQIRKIIHIDMDAFYASVEQRDGPTLKGKPVAVGYPAKTRRRCSGELRDRSFAVRSAMPSIVAIRKCAELVFVPPRFEVYREISKQIHAILPTRKKRATGIAKGMDLSAIWSLTAPTPVALLRS